MQFKPMRETNQVLEASPEDYKRFQSDIGAVDIDKEELSADKKDRRTAKSRKQAFADGASQGKDSDTILKETPDKSKGLNFYPEQQQALNN